jgi:hypothetical protein
MDDYEQRLRKRGNSNSNSSVESFTSSTASSAKEGNEDIVHGARRSGTWNGRRSEDIHGRGREREGNGEGLASKVKGRLRAFTGERRRDVTKGSPYPGT